MDPRIALSISLAAVGAVALVAWLYVGRGSPRLKRLALRVLLIAVAAALFASPPARAVLARSSAPFAAALGIAVLLVVVGNLYAVRFCPKCGRMHRNLRDVTCRRCGATLSRHGFTDELRRAPLDPRHPLRGRRGVP